MFAILLPYDSCESGFTISVARDKRDEDRPVLQLLRGLLMRPRDLISAPSPL